MPGGVKGDIKFGFFIGVGFLLLALALVAARLILARARSQATG